MANFQSLNHDVLSMILSFVEPLDALNLLATFKSLYHIAKRRALSKVILYRSQQVIRFCNYALADVPGRLYALQDLAVMTAAFGTSMDFWSKEVRTNLLPMITDLLEQAVNLRRLFLPQAAHLLAECPRLRLSFARLTKLEELTLEHGGNESVASLCQVNCGLQHLNLSGRWYEDQISGGELFAAMGHFANLHTLILTNVEESGGVVRAALARQQWPTVRNLRLFRCNDPLPVFAHAFPNVRSLYVWMMGLRPHRSETCWAELDYVNGTPRDLKLWLRTCPVRHLELDTTLDNADMDDYVDSIAVLLSLKPVFLTLSVERTLNSAKWQGIIQSMNPQTRCLELDLQGCWWYDELCFWMNSILCLLSPLPIVCFLFSVSGDCQDSSGDGQSIAAMDGVWETIPAEFSRSIPSLRYFAFSVHVSEDKRHAGRACCPILGKRRWWRITQSDPETKSEQIVTPLSYGLGETIRDYVLSSSCRLENANFQVPTNIGDTSSVFMTTT